MREKKQKFKEIINKIITNSYNNLEIARSKNLLSNDKIKKFEHELNEMTTKLQNSGKNFVSHTIEEHLLGEAEQLQHDIVFTHITDDL